jgi:hypothetical protein
MVLRGILSLNVRLTKIRMLTKFSHGTGAINVLVLEILPYDYLSDEPRLHKASESYAEDRVSGSH